MRGVPRTNVERMILWWMRVRAGMAARRTDEEVFHRVDPDARASEVWERAVRSVSARFLFSGRNQKEFFLGLLTRMQSMDEILDEADADTPSAGVGPDRRLDAVWRLGKAWWVTRHHDYRSAFHELLEQHQARYRGRACVDGDSIRDIAIRTIHLVAGIAFFGDMAAQRQPFWNTYLKTVFHHGSTLHDRLAYHAGNVHDRLSLALGLMAAGICFAEYPVGVRWIFEGEKRFLETLRLGDLDVHALSTMPPEQLGALLEAVVFGQLLSGRVAGPVSQQVHEYARRIMLRAVPLVNARPTRDEAESTDHLRLLVYAKHFRHPLHEEASMVAALACDDRDLLGRGAEFSQLALWTVGTGGFEQLRRWNVS